MSTRLGICPDCEGTGETTFCPSWPDRCKGCETAPCPECRRYQGPPPPPCARCEDDNPEPPLAPCRHCPALLCRFCRQDAGDIGEGLCTECAEIEKRENPCEHPPWAIRRRWGGVSCEACHEILVEPDEELARGAWGWRA